jgi:hypothetical protein
MRVVIAEDAALMREGRPGSRPTADTTAFLLLSRYSETRYGSTNPMLSTRT